MLTLLSLYAPVGFKRNYQRIVHEGEGSDITNTDTKMTER